MMQTTSSVDASWEVCIDELEALPSRPIEERVEIVERLIRNPLPGIREQALRIGIAVLSDEILVNYLRSDADAIARNAGLEILKKKGSQSLPLAIELLGDDDSDVALQAVLIVDHIGDPRALEPLRSVLRHPDTNIVQAAMVAIGHLGDQRVIPDLLPFLEQDLWLQMAAVQALGDLRCSEAIAPISKLLGDLMVGSTAAEGIAQIGGPEAFEVLSNHWLAFRDTLDPENILGLLAHILEGLEQDPEYDAGLRPALAEHLRDPYRGVRFSAARCLLALGAGAQDTEALSVLLADDPNSEVLPSCLRRRSDLARTLLERPFPLIAWGFLLSARDPGPGLPRDARRPRQRPAFASGIATSGTASRSSRNARRRPVRRRAARALPEHETGRAHPVGTDPTSQQRFAHARARERGLGFRRRAHRPRGRTRALDRGHPQGAARTLR